jgi:hypothetical protein
LTSLNVRTEELDFAFAIEGGIENMGRNMDDLILQGGDLARRTLDGSVSIIERQQREPDALGDEDYIAHLGLQS